MKVTDLEAIKTIALGLIDYHNPIAIDYMDAEQLADIMTDAYINNDTCKEVTHRKTNTPTIIITQQAVSVILDDIATRYKSRLPLCLYDDPVLDLENILSSIDFCFERLEERM